MWSLHVRADEQALVSGSADKDVKFWEFEYDVKDGVRPIVIENYTRPFLIFDRHRTDAY